MMNAPSPALADETMPGPVIALAGERFVADLSGALWHGGTRTLIVADLHLEKGSFFAARRQMLPPYDTVATLARLTEAVARHDPKRIIALGDSFHDAKAHDRLPQDAVEAISALARGRDLIWIAGNHDAVGPAGLPGDCAEDCAIGRVRLQHEPRKAALRNGEAEIAGHLHPVARIATGYGRLRRRCFAHGGGALVLPAFGAYAGGLNIRDRAFAGLFGQAAPQALVMGDKRLFAFPAARTLPD
jgi:uncharacterized protein